MAPGALFRDITLRAPSGSRSQALLLQSDNPLRPSYLGGPHELGGSLSFRNLMHVAKRGATFGERRCVVRRGDRKEGSSLSLGGPLKPIQPPHKPSSVGWGPEVSFLVLLIKSWASIHFIWEPCSK